MLGLSLLGFSQKGVCVCLHLLETKSEGTSYYNLYRHKLVRHLIWITLVRKSYSDKKTLFNIKNQIIITHAYIFDRLLNWCFYSNYYTLLSFVYYTQLYLLHWLYFMKTGWKRVM